MKSFVIVGIAGLLALGACSKPDAEVTVKCPNTNVIMTGALANEIKLATGELEFGKEVCKTVKAVDASSYKQPTEVKVDMLNGKSYQVKLQATGS